MGDHESKIHEIEKNQAVMSEVLSQQQRTLDQHVLTTKEGFDSLKGAIDAQATITNNLNQTLRMIQYILMGGVGVYIMMTMGWLEGLKFII